VIFHESTGSIRTALITFNDSKTSDAVSYQTIQYYTDLNGNANMDGNLIWSPSGEFALVLGNVKICFLNFNKSSQLILDHTILSTSPNTYQAIEFL
jgi:hypothetical protein